MSDVTAVSISRFKRIQSLNLPIARINLLVGSNNSGKSSVLQAIHFAVSLAQSWKLTGGAFRHSGSVTTTMATSQLLYMPSIEMEHLVYESVFTQKLAVELSMTLSNSDRGTILLKRGKNKNLSTTFDGRPTIEQMASLEDIFSIYVPGLAGILRNETPQPIGVIRRALARGDANLFLRNVLLVLSRQPTLWERFAESFSHIFPGMRIEVGCDERTDEFIDAGIVIGGHRYPLDGAGTGVLQVTQIMSYAHLFSPRLLLLDEPDSHLHPDNQRRLAGELVALADERGVQLLINTHSRHLLDELRGIANLLWIKNGGLVPAADNQYADILMDLGALDAGDALRGGQVKCVVLTEDKDQHFMQVLLESSGFNMSETQIWSYSGCTKVDTALVLSQFIRENAPSATVLVHRDRDYYTDGEIQGLAKQFEGKGLRVFVTSGVDVESLFLHADHLAYCCQLTSEETQKVIELVAKDIEEELLKKMINGRMNIEFAKRRNGEEPKDAGSVAVHSARQLATNPTMYYHGKMMLGRVSAKLKELTGSNVKVAVASPSLEIPELALVAKTVWSNTLSQIADN